MKDNSLLALNLQFFADEASAEVSEVAEPIESEETAEVVDASDDTDESVTEQEVTEPAIDKNAIAAAARREAEAKLKARDAEYVRRFGHLKNPITGKAIQSEQDYFEALDAQEELANKRELEEKGIDPAIIDRAIANNPLVKQAELVIQQNQQQMIANDIDKEIKLISSFDSSIKSVEDLEKCENKETVVELVQKGYSLSDAYKVANFDRLMSKKTAAAEQKAINQAKGKSHLTPSTSGASINDGMEDIPENAIAKWRAFFPDASDKELKEKYNRAHRI